MFEARFNGEIIAQSEHTILLEGNHYFPLDSVSPEHLKRSQFKSVCPWKGIASYYHVEADGVRDANAAWTYRHPSPFARKIKNHVAFWGNVQVTERT